MSRIKSLIPLMVIVGLILIGAVSVSAGTYGFTGNIASGAQYDLYAVDLIAGEHVVATLVCNEIAPGDRPLDPILSVFFPGSDSSDTIFADQYNDDGFGLDDDPNGVDCNAFDSSRVQFTAPVTGTYTFRADGFGSATGPYSLNIESGIGFSDGRINQQEDAPIVLYCDGTSTVFYSVTGVPLGVVAAGGSATFGTATVAPTADGRMYVSAGLPDGKSYLFVWSGCAHGSFEAYNVNNGVPNLYSSGTY